MQPREALSQIRAIVANPKVGGRACRAQVLAVLDDVAEVDDELRGGVFDPVGFEARVRDEMRRLAPPGTEGTPANLKMVRDGVRAFALAELQKVLPPTLAAMIAAAIEVKERP